MSARIKASVRYDGTDFCGWQVQPDIRTVQGEIEKALLTRFGSSIRITGSGRTDTGVHAEQQIIHFDCPEDEDNLKLLRAMNSLLPEDISIVHLEKTHPGFHARFDAVSRQYRYNIHSEYSALDRRFSWEISSELNVEKMRSALDNLTGTHDFEPFSKLNPEINNYKCTVFHTDIIEKDKRIEFRIRSNRFMHGMVRAITGTLTDIGRGTLEPGIIRNILVNNDRSRVSSLAPANGLCLEKVNY